MEPVRTRKSTSKSILSFPLAREFARILLNHFMQLKDQSTRIDLKNLMYDIQQSVTSLSSAQINQLIDTLSQMDETSFVKMIQFFENFHQSYQNIQLEEFQDQFVKFIFIREVYYTYKENKFGLVAKPQGFGKVSLQSAELM